jgi:hypothetical protein
MARYTKPITSIRILLKSEVFSHPCAGKPTLRRGGDNNIVIVIWHGHIIVVSVEALLVLCRLLMSATLTAEQRPSGFRVKV